MWFLALAGTEQLAKGQVKWILWPKVGRFVVRHAAVQGLCEVGSALGHHR